MAINKMPKRKYQNSKNIKLIKTVWLTPSNSLFVWMVCAFWSICAFLVNFGLCTFGCTKHRDTHRNWVFAGDVIRKCRKFSTFSIFERVTCRPYFVGILKFAAKVYFLSFHPVWLTGGSEVQQHTTYVGPKQGPSRCGIFKLVNTHICTDLSGRIFKIIYI